MVQNTLGKFPALSLGLLAFTLPWIAGCETKPRMTAQQLQQKSNVESSKSDHIQEGLQFVDAYSRMDRDAAIKEVGYQFNTWLSKEKIDFASITKPKLLDSVPAEFQQYPPLQDLAGTNFTPVDISYIMQTRLLHRLEKWILPKPLQDKLAVAAIAKTGASLSEADRILLEDTCKLWDWTTRNVLLEGRPNDVETQPRDPRPPLSDEGLGYRQELWQTVLYGRGDFVDRGRVFVELLRLRGIDSAFLATPLGSDLELLQLWCVGVRIGGEVYLFEPRLGLAIPGKNQEGIATLKDAQQDEAILRRLAIPGRFKYAPQQPQVAKVIALIDADPASISARIAHLEKALVGEQRTPLVNSLDRAESEWKKNAEINAVRWWTLSLLTRAYSEALPERLREMSPFTATYMAKHLMYLGDSPLLRARYEHLVGNFGTQEEEMGAQSLYMECRVPEETLDLLQSEKEVQESMQMQRLPNEPLEKFEARLQRMASIYREAKVDASYLIGLLNYDLGRPESTINWMEKRAQTLAGATRWQSGIWYNQGRALEARGDLPKAIEMLRMSPSPQEAGNRIRARLLQRMLDPSVESES